MRLPDGHGPRGYRAVVEAPERPEIGRFRRRSIQLGLLVALVGGFVPFVVALQTWTRVDVACSRAGARDLSCTVARDALFTRETTTRLLLETTRFVAFDVTRGSGKQQTKTQVLAVHAHGAVIHLAEHPRAARLLPALDAFLADTPRASVQVTTGRPVAAFASLVVCLAIVIAGLSLALVGGTTVVADGERPVLVVERRFGPGLSTRREIPLGTLSHVTSSGARPRNPLRLVLRGGEEAFLFLATDQEKAGLAELIGRARSVHDAASRGDGNTREV